MKRFLLVIMVVMGALGVVSVAALADKPPKCKQGYGVTACGDSNMSQVVVGGAASSAPTPSGGNTGTPADDSPDPGTSVPCGAGTAGRLATAGDPSAAQDAGVCGGTDPCQADTQVTGIPQQQYVQLTGAGNARRLNGGFCAPARLAQARITPAMVWEQAQRLIPKAAVGLAPRQSTLVNMQTVMWVDAPAQQDLPVVTILGRPVGIHLTLARVRWNFGDDASDVTDSPGKAYDGKHDPCDTPECPHYYGHEYTTTGRMTIVATTEWSATFRVAGGPATSIPGTVDGPTATASVRVLEARGVLVPDPTPR